MVMSSFEEFQREVGRKIKRARMGRGLRQRDMVRHSYPLRHYQKIESGRANLTLRSLYKLAQAFDTEIDRLIESEAREAAVFRALFLQNPLGIIVWKLADPGDPRSLCVYDHNQAANRFVYRDLELVKGKKILEIFPKAEEQGVVSRLFEVITTGKPQQVDELIRHDVNFPLTVFNTRFVACAPYLGAAIFRDITEEYLARQEDQRRRAREALPVGSPAVTPL